MKNDAILKGEKQRIEYIDRTKFIGIFLLLVEHTGNWIDLPGEGYGNLKLWICSFHMPLFFIVYGMVSSYKELRNWQEWKKYISHQARALVVPYVLWAMIYSNGYGVNFFLGVGYGSNPSLSYANTNAVLWFLPAMFISTLLYQLVLRFVHSKSDAVLYAKVCGLGTVLALIAFVCSKVGGIRFPWGIDVACLGTVFMLIGRYMVKNIVETISKGKWYKSVIFAALFGVTGIILSNVNRPIEGIYPVTVMAIAEYGKNIVLFIAGAMASTLMVLIISGLVKEKCLVYLGRLMAVHYIMFPYTLFCAKMIAGSVSPILIALLNATFVTVLCIPASMLIDQFCACLNGK